MCDLFPLLHRWLKNLISRYCSRAASEKVKPRWEQDYELQPISKLGLFYEYLEMGKMAIKLHPLYFLLHLQL